MPFDMVLSDINMPQMDGLSLLEHIPERGPRHALGHHFGLRRHEKHPGGDESRRLRFRDQADWTSDDLRVTIERTLKNLEAQWREAESFASVRLAAHRK